MSELRNSKSVFNKLSNNQIETIIQKYASPCFIINENALIERVKLFQQTILKQYKNSIAAYCSKNSISKHYYPKIL